MNHVFYFFGFARSFVIVTSFSKFSVRIFEVWLSAIDSILFSSLVTTKTTIISFHFACIYCFYATVLTNFIIHSPFIWRISKLTSLQLYSFTRMTNSLPCLAYDFKSNSTFSILFFFYETPPHLFLFHN